MVSVGKATVVAEDAVPRAAGIALGRTPPETVAAKVADTSSAASTAANDRLSTQTPEAGEIQSITSTNYHI